MFICYRSLQKLVSDKQHFVPQWYLRNFRSNPGSTNNQARIYRMSSKDFEIDDKRIKTIARQESYLNNEADKILSNNESKVSKLITDLVSAEYSHTIKEAYFKLICFNEYQLPKNCENYQEFCKFILLLEMRSPYMRKRLDNGFNFNIVTNDQVIGSGEIKLSSEGLKEIHSSILTRESYEILKLIDETSLSHEGSRKKITKDELDELVNSDDYKEFKENNPSIRKFHDEEWKDYAKYYPLIVLNKSEIEFVTSQNPIIKTQFFDDEINIDDSYFFPISPKMGLLLVVDHIFKEYYR